jgi:Family of unknown function (DUF5367)
MRLRLTLYGLVGWMAATVALRMGGQYLLRPGDLRGTLVLFALSFPLMALLVRRLSKGLGGAVAVLAPTLLLDPFSSAFFPVVFPNMAPEMAGVFGGWMLWCCAGGLLGTTFRRSTPE